MRARVRLVRSGWGVSVRSLTARIVSIHRGAALRRRTPLTPYSRPYRREFGGGTGASGVRTGAVSIAWRIAS